MHLCSIYESLGVTGVLGFHQETVCTAPFLKLKKKNLFDELPSYSPAGIFKWEFNI
jgi:hypothetical protein